VARTLRIVFVILTSLSVLLSPADAFETPLSDTGVREAYFLGQRSGDTVKHFLGKYTLLPVKPESGPHIQAISFLTPYALIAQLSSQHVGNYSAQQAQIDHRKQPEFVRVVVQIGFTETYGLYLSGSTNSRSGSQAARRAADFWKDFRVRTFSEDKFVTPINAEGAPSYSCDGPSDCVLTGAVVKFEYPASAFDGQKAIVQVEPPEGDRVTLAFDLSDLQ
jgi:hypothetical protein